MNIKEILKYQMPEGWWDSFGEQMCQEIQDEIDGWADEELEWFDITTKEKYGELRIYCSAENDTLDEIFCKYETLARHTCICCGQPASWISKGWIAPYCNKCAAVKFDIRAKNKPSIEWFDMFSEIKKEE